MGQIFDFYLESKWLAEHMLSPTNQRLCIATIADWRRNSDDLKNQNTFSLYLPKICNCSNKTVGTYKTRAILENNGAQHMLANVWLFSWSFPGVQMISGAHAESHKPTALHRDTCVADLVVAMSPRRPKARSHRVEVVGVRKRPVVQKRASPLAQDQDWRREPKKTRQLSFTSIYERPRTNPKRNKQNKDVLRNALTARAWSSLSFLCDRQSGETSSSHIQRTDTPEHNLPLQSPLWTK